MRHADENPLLPLYARQETVGGSSAQLSNALAMMRTICSTCEDVMASGIRMSISVASQIPRSSRGFQNGRNSSILGQRFMTTFRPASSASCGGLVVVDADLHPEHLGADGDGLLGDAVELFLGAEDLHHVDGPVDLGEGPPDLEATDLGRLRFGLTGIMS